jgi:transcription antitermination protein NusB
MRGELEKVLLDGQEGENAPKLVGDDLSQRDIRTLIFYLLYAMEAFDYTVSLESVADNFSRGFHIAISPEGEVFKRSAAIIREREELDQEIKPLLSNWRLERLGYSTRLILRMAVWELKHTDTAASIIINEAIELAKCFAELDAYKFINGVLDEWLKRHRTEAGDQSDNNTTGSL